MVRRMLVIVSLLVAGITLFNPVTVQAYNYGDYKSSTLNTKAWKALSDGDLDAVLAYTNKNMELYAEQAKKMQASLTEFATGSKDEIFAYWALNDVATALFIQGEAYKKSAMIDEATAAYHKLIDEYGFGQCWDTKGWFWKPAEAAKEKLALLESGSNLDFGDAGSATLAVKAWKALADNDTDAVVAYVDKCISLYGTRAKEMQDSLTEYPWESKEKIFSYWALNDVGTCLFIKGEAFKKAGNIDEALMAYQTLVDEYFYAQCWDPQGWFWKPAEAAEQKLNELTSG